MTKLENFLRECEERANKATKGTWEFIDQDDNQYVVAVVKKAKNPENDKLKHICALPGISAMTKDFQFIAHARTDIPLLLALLKEAIRVLNSIPEECSIWGGNLDAIKYSKEAIKRLNEMAEKSD